MSFEDHCVEGCQLISIADNINETAKKWTGQVFPKNHVCIILWSGTDFSWLEDDQKDILAQQDDYLQDNVSILVKATKFFPACPHGRLHICRVLWTRGVMAARPEEDENYV